MKTSYPYRLRSHPDKLLQEHLKNVALLCREKVQRANIDFCYPKDVLAEVVYIIGVTHDIGKGTGYFQEYLEDNISGKKTNIKDELKEHGFISAVLTFGLVNRYICSMQGNDGDMAYLPYIAFFVAKRHHGNLEDLNGEMRYTPTERKHKKQVIEKQIASMDIQEVLQIIDILLGVKLTHDEFIDIYENAFDKITFDEIEDEETMGEMLEKGSIEYYFIEKFLFSVLVSSDKTEVILGEKIACTEKIPGDLIDKFLEQINSKKKSPLNTIRQKAYTEVTQKVLSIDLKDRILSISLPTGLGKTFTSVSFALKFIERLEKGSEYNYKLIYCLPFTSIIDQNYSVMEDVLTDIDGVQPSTAKLLKHHYLSDVFYDDSKKEYEIDKSQHLINTWESAMVVTTFVQFFQTIFSNKNKALMKFNSMANSVIILDEIQSIPYKYWLLLNQVLPIIAEKMDIYFILVTATQPLIFNRIEGEVKELVDKQDYYFSLFNRTRLNIRLDNVMYIEDFCEEMGELVSGNPKKDILIVLNTIKSSRQVYNYLRQLNLDNTELIYLSTAIIPKERTKRIKRIGEDSESRKVVVSTQLIEAGVDIDMDIVVRDMGPWDSIIQVAGRANRNDKGGDGDVYIYALKDDYREFYSYIYKKDSLTIDKTFELLNRCEVIEEKEYGSLTEEYFRKIHFDGDASANTSMELLNDILRMKFKTVNDDFQLIDHLPNKVDVFVESDDEAVKLWKRFQQINGSKDVFERRRQFLTIKKDFYQYVISVDSKDVEMDDLGWFGYISKNQLENTYNIETGYEQIYKDAII